MEYLVSNIKYIKGKDNYDEFSKKTDISAQTLRNYNRTGTRRNMPSYDNILKIFNYAVKENILTTTDELFFKDLTKESEKSRETR